IASEARDAAVDLAAEIEAGAEAAEAAIDDLADEATSDLRRIEHATSRAARKLATDFSLAAAAAKAAMAGKFLIGGPVLLGGVGAIGGGIAALLAGLASAVGGLIPIIGQLVSTIVSAAGALAILPGVIGGIITIFATLKIATSGVGEAFSALASGDVDKLDEALKKLSPSARVFVKELGALKPELDTIKASVQEAFFKDLAAVLKPLVENLIPVLRVGLTSVAESLNGVVANAV